MPTRSVDADNFLQSMSYLEWEIVDSRCMIAASALSFFDFALTLPEEVQLVWKRPLSKSKVLWIVLRYSNLAQQLMHCIGVLLHLSNYTGLSEASCVVVLRTYSVLIVAWQSSVCGFAVLCIYGIWGRKKGPVIAVTLLGLATVAILIYGDAITTYHLVSDECVLSTSRGIPMMASDGLSVMVTFLPVVIYGIVVCLAWIKTLRIQKNARFLRRNTSAMRPLLELIRVKATMFYL
ncbi:hypothetical protein C8Q79DRAFT_969414 [Trametes meyenii]|nr:hypothetical protein C8Q79DRAFT_969414 [Trametes meyenii]